MQCHAQQRLIFRRVLLSAEMMRMLTEGVQDHYCMLWADVLCSDAILCVTSIEFCI